MGVHIKYQPNMKLAICAAVLVGASAEINTKDFPDLEFPTGCENKKTKEKITSGKIPDGFQCKAVRCKNYKKHKMNVKIIDGAMVPALECLPKDEIGCVTEWGFTYRTGKKITHFPKYVGPKNYFIGCGYNGGSEKKVRCSAVKAKTNPKLTFQWAKNADLTDLDCPKEAGTVWATWNEWSDCINSKCERTEVTRSRKCYGGTNVDPVDCKNEMDEPSTQSAYCYPEVCGKCHADMGLYMFKFLGIRPVGKWLPWANTRKFLTDGWMDEGRGILNVACMDQDGPEGPKKKTCKCDQKGCYFDTAPSCSYEDYGLKYHWSPGASNTWTSKRNMKETYVKDDYSIAYEGSEKDPRFADRVAWWPNGPSICRVVENILLPGVERPVMKNDAGGIDYNKWNKLECDMQIEFYPGFSGQSTSNFGSHSYEVLRSSNTTWKKASEASFEKMVVVGNYNKGAKFDTNQVYGLCRLPKCTLKNGSKCSTAASNHATKDVSDRGQYHPGLVSRKSGKFECYSILGAGSGIKEGKDLDAFEVLVVA